MVTAVVVAVAAVEAIENLMRESKISQKILKTTVLSSDERTWKRGGSFEFFGWSNLLAETTGMCQRCHRSCGYAAEGVLLQCPSECQANSPLRDQWLFSSHEKTTIPLCIRYSCRMALTSRTSPEATTQVLLMLVTINSTKIQWGCSAPTDESNHP